MKFNGVPIKYDDLHVWTMADKNGVERSWKATYA